MCQKIWSLWKTSLLVFSGIIAGSAYPQNMNVQIVTKIVSPDRKTSTYLYNNYPLLTKDLNTSMELKNNTSFVKIIPKYVENNKVVYFIQVQHKINQVYQTLIEHDIETPMNQTYHLLEEHSPTRFLVDVKIKTFNLQSSYLHQKEKNSMIQSF